MTTSNEITLDHISAFFSLETEVEPLNIAPTATGGAGIDNRDQFPAPKPFLPLWRRVEHEGTEYVQKYLDKEEKIRQSTQNLGIDQYQSLNSLNDVEDSLADEVNVSDLESESTHQIYSTYFNVPKNCDRDLSITSYREEILQQLNIHPVVVIQGPTGCGKTTQVPQYILDYHQSQGTYCNIIVTQPRKIAAISIARRVCQERKWNLGSIVGYQVAMDAKVSADTRLSYVTTGVLLEKLVAAKRMDMYTHIILDEIHERNQDIDFALLLVKKFLKTNSQKVKIILMSATFDSTMFAKYFALSKQLTPAPIIEIFGKSKDVTEHYLHELSTLINIIPDFDACKPMIHPVLYDAVLKLMFIFDKIEKAEQKVPADKPYAPNRGAVLIFLPGYEEISLLSDKLQTASLSQNFWIIPLHSSITVEEQTKVFRSTPPDQRKVILSTNIAESSITVPDVKYVIDFCLTKNLITDSITNYTSLCLEWASKSNCIQRKGRAGRVDIGKVYRMVPRNFYNDFADYNVPEIKRCPLTKTLLHLKKLDICEPQEMLAFALDPPKLSDIHSAILQLKEALGLTTRGDYLYDGDLTFIGRVMANLPLDIKLTKLVIFGYVFRCLEECIIIAASLSLQSFFSKPFKQLLDAYRSKLAWAGDKFSDCITYLYAYRMWKQHTMQGFFRRPNGLTEPQWMNRHFIQIRRIKEVDMLVKEIKSRLEQLQITCDRRRGADANINELMLKIVIAGAFFPNFYHQDPMDEEKINREINDNDPLSTVVVSNLPAKHGILYASALKDMFLCCDDNMEIEFEEKRAYIKFPRRHDSSPILRPVLLALKMRKLNMQLKLSVFSQEEAERKTKQLMSSRSSDSSNRLFSNRITVKCANAQTVDLPSLSQDYIKIFITHVNNCGHFWAQCIPKNSNLLRFLDTTINASKGANLQPLSKPPEIGMLCLAPFESNNARNYYRAQIKDIYKTTADVFFVDYGNISFAVPIHCLREISAQTPDVLNTQFLAFECQLAEIKPSSLASSSGDWCDKANIWFKNQVSGSLLHAKVYSVVQNVARLDILKKSADGQTVSLNQQLLTMQYGVTAEESLVSRQNHELRKKAASYTMSMDGLDNLSRDLEMSWKEAAECKIMPVTQRTINIHGPYNPLEASYCGLTMIDRTKCVRVERDSVNSVSMNPDPQNTYTTLLVASHVSVGSTSNDLIVRNTTLMPKLRGLSSLICLIFSPNAEIRTDKERKTYTGVLCGLGYDSQTMESIYPEHDIELPFDVEISPEDIQEINTIRMGINLLLSSGTDTFQYKPSSRIIHENAQSTLMSLFNKKREPVEPVLYRQPYAWNKIPEEFMQAQTVEVDPDGPSILPLHKSAILTSVSREVMEMREHLKKLYELAENSSQDYKVITCRFCSKDLHSTRDLLVHLNRDEHQRREKRIRKNL